MNAKTCCFLPHSRCAVSLTQPSASIDIESWVVGAGSCLSCPCIEAGDMPVWDVSGFAILFQRFQEAIGSTPSHRAIKLSAVLVENR
eukprot:2018445-Amphidinium_carterae.1